MVYIVKWRSAPGAEPMEIKCTAEAGAVQVAADRIWIARADSVWIENENGVQILDQAEIERRHKAKG
jgi:hypothetical protein